MPDTPTDIHAQLVRSVHAAEALAMRADHRAISRAARLCVKDDLLDDPSAKFLQDAPRTVIGLATALNAVLHTHRGEPQTEAAGAGCLACGTDATTTCKTLTKIADAFALLQMRRIPIIDAAEAWRRAHARHRPTHDGDIVSIVHEIADAYVVRSLVIEPPAPSRVGPNSERVLVVDKTTGRTVLWPFMPLPLLDSGYSQYRRHAGPVLLRHEAPASTRQSKAQPTRRRAKWTRSHLPATTAFKRWRHLLGAHLRNSQRPPQE
ncbi:hypothetical protein [Actinomadura rupiterrae]|uniref:hypothetical protein n=1 Tax=Actinomadura rupiterrae TaxID=559627 RepID=UPI0020A580DA|nr:hypothetical protein [Actinomadura rupiterrae]MCP2337525.1 hypothetical protein [Actinomadura rupiterrae]